MKKKSIIVLLASVVFCLGLLTTLYSISPISKSIFRANFSRKIYNKELKEDLVIDVKYNSYYIAGFSDHYVFLANHTSPLHVLIVDYSSGIKTEANIKITDLNKIKSPEEFRMVVDSPFFHLTHGITPAIFRGYIGQWIAKSSYEKDSDYFVNAIPIGKNSYALRSLSGFSGGYELGKKKPASRIEFNLDLLQKQIDGIFCVDGELHYSKGINRLVYQYFYRNEFIVSDTNLNLIYRGHTIDTFSHARVKVADVGNYEKMLSEAPTQTNIQSCVDGNFLLVRSNLLAQNDEIKNFRNESIIDVYNLIDHQYVFSFYIKNLNSSRLLSFRVNKGYLFAMYGEKMVVYRMPIFPTIDTTAR